MNLSPFPTPKDVYSDVVELVERERQRDSKNDNAIADLLDTFVERKVSALSLCNIITGFMIHATSLIHAFFNASRYLADNFKNVK